MPPSSTERRQAGARRARLLPLAGRPILFASVFAVLFLGHLDAGRAATCFGAPPGVKTQYPEPRVFEEAQSWWLERGKPRQILHFPGAMRANHVHLGLCFPQGERIHPIRGRIHYSFLGKLHEFRRGVATFVRGGIPDSGPHNGFRHDFHWKPHAETEERVFRGSSRVRKLTACGRREWRFTLNAENPHHHRRQYQSFGSQAYIKCRGKRKRDNYRDADVMIFRSWYKRAEYTNVAFGDESAHRYEGFRAHGMAQPVPLGWTVKWSISEGAKHVLLAVDPDVHHGTFGMVLARGRRTSGKTTIPVSVLEPGIHNLMLVGCERVRRHPKGTSCGVGVIPFRVR